MEPAPSHDHQRRQEPPPRQDEPHDYQRLNAEAVKTTVLRLSERIEARFPDRNLRHVCRSLAGAVDDLLIQPQSRWYSVAKVGSRALLGLIGLIAVVGITMLIVQAADDRSPETVWEWIQIIESIINDVVFAGIAIFFLWQFPGRLQRAHDLEALHRLRSLAHVIDMHQLTKDPERLRPDFKPTSASMDIGLDAIQLGNYLDYCSEMLSLVGKTAALFAEKSTDTAVLHTVEGIEDLTTGMSRKIWQKIALLPRGQALGS